MCGTLQYKHNKLAVNSIGHTRTHSIQSPTIESAKTPHPHMQGGPKKRIHFRIIISS